MNDDNVSSYWSLDLIGYFIIAVLAFSLIMLFFTLCNNTPQDYRNHSQLEESLPPCYDSDCGLKDIE